MIQFITVVKELNKVDEQNNHLSASLSRYCKYVLRNGETEFCSYVSEIANSQKEYIDALLKCCMFLESKNTESLGFIMALNYDSYAEDVKYVQTNCTLSLLDTLLTNKNIWQSLQKINTEIREALDWYYFNQALDNFRHGQKSDIVNSKLGLLKVYLDNTKISFAKENINKELIFESLGIIKELQQSLNDYKSINDLTRCNTKIRDNIDYCNYIIGGLIDACKNTDIEEIKENRTIQSKLSSCISDLFLKISYYKR